MRNLQKKKYKWIIKLLDASLVIKEIQKTKGGFFFLTHYTDKYYKVNILHIGEGVAKQAIGYTTGEQCANMCESIKLMYPLT